MPRLYVAGPVRNGRTSEEARKAVDDLVTEKPDVLKFREDDHLGTRPIWARMCMAPSLTKRIRKDTGSPRIISRLVCATEK
jgi:hypothetical protein